MNIPIETPKWYAIYTRSNFEKKIFNALNKSGFEVFLPLVKVKKKIGNQLRNINVPLLPGYVFIHIPEAEYPKCYYYPGFVRFISSDGKPSEIKESEIHFLRKIITCGYEVGSQRHIEIGEKVRIVRGPLKNWEGVVSDKRGNSKVVFQFDSLQQSIGVEVPMSNIELVK